MSTPPPSASRMLSRMITGMAALIVVLAVSVVVLVIRDHNQDVAIRSFSTGGRQQNVTARHQDCMALEDLRSALRAQVVQGEALDPALLRLIPSLNTPDIRAFLKANNAKQLRAYAPVDCRAYALAAVPPGQRSQYQVP